MDYLYNPQNRCISPFSRKLKERMSFLVKVTQEQAMRLSRGENFDDVMGRRTVSVDVRIEKKDEPKSAKLGLNVNGMVTEHLNEPPKPAEEAQAAQEPEPEQHEPEQPAPEAKEPQEPQTAQEPGNPEQPTPAPSAEGEGDKDPFADDGDDADEQEPEPEQPKPLDVPPPKPPRTFDGLDRTNVEMSDFESCTDEELPAFAKKVLGITFDMNPTVEDKATLDIAAYRKDIRARVGNMVQKVIRKRKLSARK